MQIKNQQYIIGGVKVLDLVKQFDTPIYVYDSSQIISQYQKLTQAIDVPDLRINYACKANTNPAILKLMQALGSGIDAVSYGEVLIALQNGFKPDRIMYTPSSVDLKEVEAVMETGVMINIDNLVILENLGHKYPGIELGIRINPHIMAGGNDKISTGHIDSKFGISIHQLPLVKRIIENLGIKLQGLHMHTGSDILDVDVFLRAADILFNTAAQFPNLSYIDFGSGFKVAYKKDDYETNVAEFGKKISEKFVNFCKSYGKSLQLIFEPGKYLVSSAGYFLVKTNVVKQTPSTIFVGVNSGFNHLIRPMFYNSYHEIVNISNPKGNPRLYTVVGYICETDTFAYNRKIAEIKTDDILCFKNAGAYCSSMASRYNSRFLPAEILVHQGKPYLIREADKLEDLTRKYVDAPIDDWNG